MSEMNDYYKKRVEQLAQEYSSMQAQKPDEGEDEEWRRKVGAKGNEYMAAEKEAKSKGAIDEEMLKELRKKFGIK